MTAADQAIRAAPTVVYGPKPRIANVAMNMWTTRAFCVDFVADLDRGISGVAEFDGTTLKANVRNDSALRLSDCRLVHAGTAGGTKDLDPGQEVVLDAGAARQIHDRSRYSDFRSYRYMETRAVITDLAMRALFGRPSSSPGGAPQDTSVYFVGVAADPVVPVDLNRGRPEINDCNLVVVRLPLRLARKRTVSVPPKLIRSRLVAGDGVLPGRPDMGERGFVIQDGSAVMEFQVPLGEAGGTAQKLVLNTLLQIGAYAGSASPTPSGGGRGPRAGPTGRGETATVLPPSGPATGAASSGVAEVAAYNFAREKWDPVFSAATAIQKNVGLPAPADHTSADGRVLLRIGAQSATVTVETCDLSADVKTF